jgi:hypothetical protein
MGQLSIKPVISTIVIAIILQSTLVKNNTNNQSARLINYNRFKKTDILSPSLTRTFSKFQSQPCFKMHFQNIIPVIILTAIAMARPQTLGQAYQSLSLES